MKRLSVKLNGEEIANLKASSYEHSPEPIEADGEMPKLGVRSSMKVAVTDDDSNGWKDLLPKSYEVEWHVGDGVYKATMSRQEFQRMIDDGVLK